MSSDYRNGHSSMSIVDEILACSKILAERRRIGDLASAHTDRLIVNKDMLLLMGETATKSNLRDELNRTNARLDGTTHARDHARKMVLELENENARLSLALERLREGTPELTELNQVARERDVLKTQVRNREAERTELKRDLVRERARITDLASQLAKKNRQFWDEQKVAADLKRDLENLQQLQRDSVLARTYSADEYDALRLELYELKKTVTRIAEDHARAIEERNEARSAGLRDSNKIGKLQHDLAQAREDARRSADSRYNITMSHSEKQHMERALVKARTEADVLKSDVEGLIEQLARARKNQCSIDHTETLEAKLAIVREERDQQRRRSEELYDQLTRAKEKANNPLFTITYADAFYKEEIAGLKALLLVKGKERDAAERKRKEFGNELAKMRAEYRMQQAELRVAKQKLRSYEDEDEAYEEIRWRQL